jgi:hypothetical protein
MYGRKAVLPIDLQFGLRDTENYYDQLKPRLEVIKEKLYKKICTLKSITEEAPWQKRKIQGLQSW